MSFSVSTLLFQILSLKQIKQKKTFFIVKYETYRKMHRVQLNQLLSREDPCNLTQGQETTLTTHRNPLCAALDHTLLPPPKATTALIFTISTSLLFFFF